MGPRGVEDKRAQFFENIRKENLKGIRWGLHNVSTLRTRDEDGNLPIGLAAKYGLVRSLNVLLSYAKGKEFDLKDDNGMTALMVAAYTNRVKAVELLLTAGANKDIKSNKGKTARDLAVMQKHKQVVETIDKPPEAAEEFIYMTAEEAAAERAKNAEKKVVSLEAQLKQAKIEEKLQEKAEKEARDQELAANAEKPTWDEVEKVMVGNDKGGLHELVLDRARPDDDTIPEGQVDPAVYSCHTLNLLSIKITPPLLQLSPAISKLTDLSTLILSDNALTSLPDEIGTLANLKVFESANNTITSLPESFSKLTKLEVLKLSQNKLTSIAPLAKCTQLVTVALDSNELVELDVDFSKTTRLNRLTAAQNKLESIPASLGGLKQLTFLLLDNNAIKDIPGELATCKGLQEITLGDNPLADPKCVKILKGRNPTKELLTYLKKASKGKKKK